jgi:hypothetical protein
MSGVGGLVKYVIKEFNWLKEPTMTFKSCAKNLINTRKKVGVPLK